MPSAYILINTEIGSEDNVLEEIRNIPNTKEAYITYGVYDIVAKIEASSIDELEDTIASKIRHLKKIESTLTFLVMEKKFNQMLLNSSICV